MNKLIDIFVRSNATMALQQNLIIGSDLAGEILDACTPAEMVMLNANLPHLKALLLSACSNVLYDLKQYSSMDEYIFTETFEKLPATVNFSSEFIYFYETRLKDLIKDNLNNLINALFSFNTGLGVRPQDAFYTIKQIANQTDQQNVITHAAKFVEIAKAEIINVVIRPGFNPKAPANYFLVSIANKFQYFSKSLQPGFITSALVSQIAFANLIMEQYLGMDLIERFDCLNKMSVAAIISFEESIFRCLDHAFLFLQTIEGRDSKKLKTHLANVFLAHLPMQFQSIDEAHELADVIFNDFLIADLLYLPKVNAINGTRRLDEKVIKRNQQSLREAFFSFKEEGTFRHDVQLQSLPDLIPQIETGYFNPSFLLEGGACLLIVAYGAYRAYSFFQKPKTEFPSLRTSTDADFARVEPSSPQLKKEKSM